MLELRLIWPLLVLLTGVLMIPRFRPWLGRPGRAFLVLATSAAAFALVLWNTRTLPAGWTVSTWLGLAGGEALHLAATPETGALMLLTTFVTLVLALGSLDETWEGRSDDDDSASVLAVAAALLAVLLAANFLTLLYAFVLLDLALLYAFGLFGRGRWALTAMILGAAADVLLLAAALLVWHATGSITLTAATNQTLALRLIAAAFALRLGVFPFHLWTSPTVAHPPRLVALVPLTTLVAGGAWLARGAQLWGAAFVPEGIVFPAAVALALLGLLAWRRSDVATRLAALAGWYGSWLVWALAYGRPDLGLLLVGAGTFSLAGLALYGSAEGTREGPGLIGLVAGAAAVGVPGSALYLAGNWLLGQALYRQEPLVALLAVLGLAMATAAVLELLTSERSLARRPSRWIGLLLLSLAAWPVLGQLSGLWPHPARVTVERFETTLPLAVRLGPLLLGWLAGLFVWRVRLSLRPARGVLDALAGVASLAWLWRFVARAASVLAAGLRGAMRMVEGENYGWLLFFVFLVLFFLARG